jgi:hypothetical protein
MDYKLVFDEIQEFYRIQINFFWNSKYIRNTNLGSKWTKEGKKDTKNLFYRIQMNYIATVELDIKKYYPNSTNWCLHFQLCSLIAELASAAASEKGVTFEEAMEDRLCAYSRAVAHFPTAVKEVKIKLLSYLQYQVDTIYSILAILILW